MELEFGILPEIILYAVGLLVVYVLLYKKILFSVIDPLFIFVLTTAFASVLVIEVVPEKEDVWHFFACQFGLWIGIFTAYYFNDGFKLSETKDASRYIFDDISFLKWCSYILLCIYIVSNIFIANTKGFALLSDTPTESRVGNFQAGFAIFQKANWGVGTFLSTSLIFLLLQTGKRLYLWLLLILIVFTSLEGSKSSLLRIVISAGFIFYHPAFASKRDLVKKFQKYIPVIVAGTMTVFFTVLIKENEDVDGAVLGFIKRLLYSADTVIYYYTPQNQDYFSNFSPLSYFGQVFSPILGFLRIQAYKEALGNVMVINLMPSNASPDVVVGPNTTFYVEGRIYFGLYGAIIYSIIVGYACGLARVYYFSILRSSAFFLVFTASFCQFANKVVSDVSMAFSQFFDMSLFVIPTFLLVSIVLTDKVVIKRVKLSSSS